MTRYIKGGLQVIHTRILSLQHMSPRVSWMERWRNILEGSLKNIQEAINSVKYKDQKLPG